MFGKIVSQVGSESGLTNESLELAIFRDELHG